MYCVSTVSSKYLIYLNITYTIKNCWYIVSIEFKIVKCQNLCYLNLSLYCNLLMPFNVMLSTIYLLLLPRHSLSSFSAAVTSLHSFSQLTTLHFYSQRHQQNCLLHTTFITPFIFTLPLNFSHNCILQM